MVVTHRVHYGLFDDIMYEADDNEYEAGSERHSW